MTLRYKIVSLLLGFGSILFAQTEEISKTFDVDSTTVVKFNFQTASFIEVLPSTSGKIKIEADIQYTDWFGNNLNAQFKIQQSRKGNTLTIGSEIEDYTFNYLARLESSKETRDKLLKMYKGKKFKGLISGTKITIHIPKVKELYIMSQLAKINIMSVQNSIFIDTDDDIELFAPNDLEATYILSSLSGEVVSEILEVETKKDLQTYEIIAKENSENTIKAKTIISLKTLERIILREKTTMLKDDNKILKDQKKQEK